MNTPPLIGIAGLAGSGKDTVANFLVNDYGYTRYGMADPIKELLNTRFGWTPEMWEERSWKEGSSALFGNGPQESPNGNPFWGNFSPRSWAQWLGTEAGRLLHGEDCWIKIFDKHYRKINAYRAPEVGVRFVIPDVRFENEADYIRLMEGSIIHIIRPGTTPVAAHSSEAGIKRHESDFVIQNVGTLEDLHTSTDNAIRSLSR